MTFPHADALRDTLWPALPGDRTQLYAVLDGARNDAIYPAVVQSDCEHECLYTGELEPDLVQAAPWLVRLQRGHPFTELLIHQGWGDSWGIYLRSATPFKQLRRHLRTFLMVYSPDIKPMYFRYYDPRVLRAFLPTCDREQLDAVFGPVQCYLFEDADADSLQQCSLGSGALQTHTIRLAAAARSGTMR